MTADAARHMPPEEEDELIKVFCSDNPEPASLVDIEHSILSQCGGFTVRLYRLYVVDDGKTDDSQYEQLRETVRKWEAE